MPLSTTGESVLNSMQETYAGKGGKKKAKRVFYASINAGKPGSEKWETGQGRAVRKKARGSHHG